MAKYLVTGSAGFIGAQVSGQLLELGHQVTGLDNLNDAYDVRLKQWRLKQLDGREDFAFIQADICNLPLLRQVFAGDFDAVINLAARAGVRPSVENPHVYFEANVTGTLNLLELCRSSSVQKFVLASTSSVYGADTPRPFAEDSNTTRPLSPYAASKMAAEALAYAYYYLHGINTTVLRYFTVYGPAGRPDMVIFRFIRSIIEGESITVYGDGTQERDFTHVEDIARGTVAALNPTGYQVINLGSDRPVPLSYIISTIEDIVGKKATVRRAPRHPSDMQATWADIRRAGHLLGWKPLVSLEEGIAGAARWYRENRGWAKDIA